MNTKKIGVVGCGVMGAGIAQLCAQAGYDVLISDVNDELLKRGLQNLDRALAKRVVKGKLSPDDKASTLARIRGTTRAGDFVHCDLMIEAAVEDMAIKRKIFAELDGICPEHAILGTNTGTLSIIDIARATKRPDKVVGLHFFNPPQVMKLVELIKTIVTSTATIETARDFAVSLGKTVVVAPDVPGFLVNRLLAPMGLNAIRMLEAGIATKEDIDAAVRLGTNMAMGPLERADLIGLDVVLDGNEAMYREYKDPQYAPPILLKKMVALGWLGRKTKKGFYDYND
jgi:3-hydroxybutyryl-CoA dehydrogenase